MDFSNISSNNSDVSYLKDRISFYQTYYSQYIENIYIYNSGLLFKIIYNIVKPFLDKEIKKNYNSKKIDKKYLY